MDVTFTSLWSWSTVIETTQTHSTDTEFRLCAGSNPAHGVPGDGND